MVGSVPFLLVTHPQLPVNSVAELIVYARANPGKLNYSSFGENTTNHFAGELFKSLTQINTLHVPYKGSGPSIIDLISGQIQYSFDAPAAVMEQVRGGRLKALAIAGTQRLANAPNIPTFAEQGLTTFTAGTWFGILTPSKTPQTVVDRLNAEVNAVLASPDLLKVFADRDIVPAGGSAQDFRSFIVSETGKWKKLALEVGIRAQ
jgi:tripartite-type tricarboxylate transporter receptor subunit TctC